MISRYDIPEIGSPDTDLSICQDGAGLVVLELFEGFEGPEPCGVYCIGGCGQCPAADDARIVIQGRR